MSMGKVIPMKRGCAIGIYLMYISAIFKLYLYIVTFISKLALGLDTEEMNRLLGVLEVERFQWHVACPRTQR